MRTRICVGLLAALALVGAAPAQAAKKGHTVTTMTRNLYLGADLAPGLQAKDFNGLVDAAGEILNQVDANNFPTRAKGLAAEILAKRPDVVGLQEAALWRTAPCQLIIPPAPPTATTVRYDFIKLLLAQLKHRYRLVVAQPEFDFETEANTDGSADHSCDTNARLTMRDAILVRTGKSVKTRNVSAGHFSTLYTPKLVGLITLPVTRGWTAAQVKVGSAPWLRFVNTHLEAFDNSDSNPTGAYSAVGNGQIREAQARELFAKGGPAAGKAPVILIGDLNSDKATEVKPGDGLAYKALLGAGFAERSATKPLGCCLNTGLLTAPGGGGKVSDFDHKVDHVMTNAPAKIKLLSSAVTGRSPVNGFWDSDHAGLFSALSVP